MKTAAELMSAFRDKEIASLDTLRDQFLMAFAESSCKRDPKVPLIDSVDSGIVYYYVGEEDGDVRVKECPMSFYGPVVRGEIVVTHSRLNSMRVPTPEEWKQMRMPWLREQEGA